MACDRPHSDAFKGAGSHRMSAAEDPNSDTTTLSASTFAKTPALILYHLFEDPAWFDSMGIAGKPFKLASFILIWVINVLILISTFAFCLESRPVYSPDPHRNPEPSEASVWEDRWLIIEVVCVVCFTLDLIVRFAGAVAAGSVDYSDVDEDEKGPPTYVEIFWGDAMNWIDLIAILPFYITLIPAADGFPDLRFVRVIRLARILKSMPGARHGNLIGLITGIITGSSTALMIPMYFMSLSLIVMAALVYYVEDSASQTCTLLDGTVIKNWNSHRDTFGNEGCLTEYGCQCAGVITYVSYEGTVYSDEMFASIGSTCWWCIVSYTTVGYGDTYPRTVAGRYMGFVVMATGLFFLAMPISIVGDSFNTNYSKYTKVRDINVAEEKMLELAGKIKTKPEGLKQLVKKKDVEATDDEIQMYLNKGRQALEGQEHQQLREALGLLEECASAWEMARDKLSEVGG